MRKCGGAIAVVVWIFVVTTSAQEGFNADAHLLFLTTFDDTTDVNLFGNDNDAGWIYTAESTRRAKVLMQNRCPSVTIAKDEGKLRDCLRFAKQTEKVLFYQASPNLPSPRNNWSGSISFWLRPDTTKAGTGDSYPLQLCDGDWSRGGFFLRFPKAARKTFQFGVVSARPMDDDKRLLDLDQVPAAEQHLVTVKDAPFASDRWTLVSFTFEGVNVDAAGMSTVRLYLDGRPKGLIKIPLRIEWMHPDVRPKKQTAAIFLGINYVGDVDDLRLYNKALTDQELLLLLLVSS